MDQISEQLLNQAKEQLALAANSAKAVLALDKENVEAAAILKVVEEVEVSALESKPQSKSDLDIARDQVQSAISSRDFFQAEKLARDYTRKYPNNTDGEDLLSSVWAAMKDSQQQGKRRQIKRQSKDHRNVKADQDNPIEYY